MHRIRSNIKSAIPIIDRSFDAGSHENYYLVWLLIFANLFVTLIAVADLFFIQYHAAIRMIETIFGFIFLLEFILRTIFVAVPDKRIMTFGNLISLLVIASLFAPHLTGNLAIIRFFRMVRVVQKFREMRQLYTRKEKTEIEHEKLKRFEQWLS